MDLNTVVALVVICLQLPCVVVALVGYHRGNATMVYGGCVPGILLTAVGEFFLLFRPF